MKIMKRIKTKNGAVLILAVFVITLLSTVVTAILQADNHGDLQRSLMGRDLLVDNSSTIDPTDTITGAIIRP